MKKIYKLFEKAVITALAAIMGIIVAISIAELGYKLVTGILTTSNDCMLINIDDLYKVFGLVFNVLIGFELYETVRLYLDEDVFHAELILLVGLIAISRKVVLLDFKTTEPLAVIGMALLIGTLTGGYYLIKKTQNNNKSTH